MRDRSERFSSLNSRLSAERRKRAALTNRPSIKSARRCRARVPGRSAEADASHHDYMPVVIMFSFSRELSFDDKSFVKFGRQLFNATGFITKCEQNNKNAK